jgi:hypothetical protein
MDHYTSSDTDFVWTPWGWLRVRGWTHTTSTGTPGGWLSIQVPGTRITVQHG